MRQTEKLKADKKTFKLAKKNGTLKSKEIQSMLDRFNYQAYLHIVNL